MAKRTAGCVVSILLITSVVGSSLSAQRREIPQRNSRPNQRIDRTQSRSRTPAPQAKAPNRNAARMAPKLAPARPRQPEGFPLNEADQKKIDTILKFWEINSAKVKTFQCDYMRKEYDPVMGPKSDFAKVALGTAKFSNPDKILIEDKQVFGYQPPKKKGDKKHKLLSQEHIQHWLCDGKSVVVKDYRNKTLLETVLPPNLRGKAIATGPLPFMFGSKAKTMKERYWIREVAAKGEANRTDYHIEAIPKNKKDAANYEKIYIVLRRVSKDQILPVKMKVTLRSIRNAGADGRQRKVGERFDEYVFKNHRVNDARDRIAQFAGYFAKPKLEKGWKKDVRDWNGNPIHGNVANRKNPATRPRKR